MNALNRFGWFMCSTCMFCIMEAVGNNYIDGYQLVHFRITMNCFETAPIFVFMAAMSDLMFSESKMDEFDAIAFGCPAMGAEELEDREFKPMFDACAAKLGGKKIALFGSYGWGDGEWMRNWEASCKEMGANLACDCVICNETPDNAAIEACKALGAALS